MRKYILVLAKVQEKSEGENPNFHFPPAGRRPLAATLIVTAAGCLMVTAVWLVTITPVSGLLSVTDRRQK